jgi:hypothetical protein
MGNEGTYVLKFQSGDINFEVPRVFERILVQQHSPRVLGTTSGGLSNRGPVG